MWVKCERYVSINRLLDKTKLNILGEKTTINEFNVPVMKGRKCYRL